MISEGIKTSKSDELVTNNFVEEHVYIGIESLKIIIEKKEAVKHLRFEW